MKISGGSVRPDDDLTRPASGPGELPAFTGPVLAPTAPHEEEVVMTLPEMQAVACPNPVQANVGGTIRRGAILALDLGTSAGWAFRSPDGHISTGTVSLKHTRYDGGGMRYLRFRRWLEQLDIDAGPIEAIFFEEVRRHAGTDAAHVYGGLLGMLTAWCEEHLVAYQGVPVGTIKRFITGKGNADKAAVIAAVQAKGFAPADDNEADAIAILLWAIETRGGVR
jgi:Holliday junction resolvasome RuvABC endonuclease subunit